MVVVDPPRAGLAGKAVRRVGELQAPRLVYVSCNPTTLAGNAKELVERLRLHARARAPGGHVPPHAAHRGGRPLHAGPRSGGHALELLRRLLGRRDGEDVLGGQLRLLRGSRWRGSPRRRPRGRRPSGAARRRGRAGPSRRPARPRRACRRCRRSRGACPRPAGRTGRACARSTTVASATPATRRRHPLLRGDAGQDLLVAPRRAVAEEDGAEPVHVDDLRVRERREPGPLAALPAARPTSASARPRGRRRPPRASESSRSPLPRRKSARSPSASSRSRDSRGMGPMHDVPAHDHRVHLERLHLRQHRLERREVPVDVVERRDPHSGSGGGPGAQLLPDQVAVGEDEPRREERQRRAAR